MAMVAAPDGKAEVLMSGGCCVDGIMSRWVVSGSHGRAICSCVVAVDKSASSSGNATGRVACSASYFSIWLVVIDDM